MSFTNKEGKWFNTEGFQVNDKTITVKLNSKTKANDSPSLNGELINKNILGYADIKVPQKVDVFEFAELLQKNTAIESIDINTFGEYVISPNDQAISNQWYLNKIGMPSAWNISVGSNCVIVAIIDSGTDWKHNDLGIGSDNYQNVYINH